MFVRNIFLKDTLQIYYRMIRVFLINYLKLVDQNIELIKHLSCFEIIGEILHDIFFQIRQSPQAASKVILACTVLHNIAIMMREPEVDDQYIDQPQPAEQYSGPEEGASVREYITRHYF